MKRYDLWRVKLIKLENYGQRIVCIILKTEQSLILHLQVCQLNYCYESSTLNMVALLCDTDEISKRGIWYHLEGKKLICFFETLSVRSLCF